MLPVTGACDDVSAMEAGSTFDPVCGRAVDPLRARAVGIFGGTTYYFCSADCKSRYADPRAPRDPNEPTRVPSKTTAPAQLPAIAAVAARAAAPAELPPARGRASRAPLVIGLLVVAAGAAAWALHARSAVKPTPQAAAVTTTPAQPAPVAAIVPPAPSTPTPADAEVSALVAPLKLGLRRFVAHADGSATLSWQLLLIDASGHATPVVVAEVPAGEEDAKAVTEEAVAPQADFLSARREPGPIFQDSVHAEGRRIDVRVTRAADMLTAETRESADGGDAEAATWHRRLHMALGESDLVRGAPFARKRYSESAEAPASK
jgi:YHS domain-containing protein